ncbi:MAG: hypothetical protein QOE59_3288, partial [Actinomycetota bacterium]|nr:hypothetical protein [Actinomycetota bacterium]
MVMAVGWGVEFGPDDEDAVADDDVGRP